jgi:uncharacterized protein (TIGR03437 family)
MKKVLASLALIVLPVSAQYTGLVTTRDGNQLYFSSSLRLRGTAEVDSPKIFRYSTGFELIQQPAASWQALMEPQVSADGTIAGYTNSSAGECIEWFCMGAPPPEFGVITGVQIPHNPLPALHGRLRLARDGRYAMICRVDIGDLVDPQLIDLGTGEVTDLKGLNALGDGLETLGDTTGGGPIVLLVDQSSNPLLYHQGKTTRLHFSHAAILARMNSDATVIVYEAADPGGKYELIAHRVGTRAEQILQVGPPVPANPPNGTPSYFQPWMSDDGSSVLFLTVDASGHQQVFYEATNGSGERALTNLTSVPEGVSAATLSGDGTIAYASTPDGRILRISVPSGNMGELAGRTPQLTQLQNSAVGSVNWISGTALSDGGDTLPRVLVGELSAPVISAESTLMKFQIPWEVRTGVPSEIRLQYGTPPPFESVLTFTAAAINGNFLSPLANPFSAALLGLHHDFHSLVTSSDPALPGEIIHFYLTGLGPVTPAVATGERTPASGPLHRVVYPPVFCTVTNIAPTGTAYLDAPLPFLGLAPGYIGLYQMDLQVPQGLVNADSPLSCAFRILEGGGYQVAAVDLYVQVP